MIWAAENSVIMFVVAGDFPRGELPYEKDDKKGGDARRKISIEPLKGTNLGVG